MSLSEEIKASVTIRRWKKCFLKTEKFGNKFQELQNYDGSRSVSMPMDGERTTGWHKTEEWCRRWKGFSFRAGRGVRPVGFTNSNPFGITVTGFEN